MHAVGELGISGQINPAGSRAFARSNGGAVDMFAYNSTTGALGATPLSSIPIADAPTLFGADQMALHPNGTKLYVSQPGALNVYDASTGAPLTSITAPGISEPTGVCFARSTVIQVTIDIKPGSSANTINPKSHGKIRVAILTTETFDATTVAPRSVRFGPDGAKAVHKKGQIKDVNDDGEPDLVLRFRIQATGIQCGDTSASLTGKTVEGEPIEGSDSIKTVGCDK